MLCLAKKWSYGTVQYAEYVHVEYVQGVEKDLNFLLNSHIRTLHCFSGEHEILAPEAARFIDIGKNSSNESETNPTSDRETAIPAYQGFSKG